MERFKYLTRMVFMSALIGLIGGVVACFLRFLIFGKINSLIILFCLVSFTVGFAFIGLQEALKR
jgi:hypothetical protein